MKAYSPTEEKINVASHACGFFLSVIAMIFLIAHAITDGGVLHIATFTVFGVSLCVLYAASTLYHSAKNVAVRSRLKIFDHASIYVLIAGTYTPFTLVTIQGAASWIIFGISWGAALAGIVLKIFFTGRYSIASTIMYVLMGWVIIFAIKPLVNSLPWTGCLWLFGGGIAYTIGAILYSIKGVKLNHAIFHLLVLIGSFCHFISVFYYVLPTR